MNTDISKDSDITFTQVYYLLKANINKWEEATNCTIQIYNLNFQEKRLN